MITFLYSKFETLQIKSLLTAHCHNRTMQRLEKIQKSFLYLLYLF